MTESEVATAIADVLRKIAPEANVAGLQPNDDLREALDIDSFDFLNVLVGLHERLGVDVPESDYGRVRTLATLRAYLLSHAR